MKRMIWVFSILSNDIFFLLKEKNIEIPQNMFDTLGR